MDKGPGRRPSWCLVLCSQDRRWKAVQKKPETPEAITCNIWFQGCCHDMAYHSPVPDKLPTPSEPSQGDTPTPVNTQDNAEPPSRPALSKTPIQLSPATAVPVQDTTPHQDGPARSCRITKAPSYLKDYYTWTIFSIVQPVSLHSFVLSVTVLFLLGKERCYVMPDVIALLLRRSPALLCDRRHWMSD